MTMPSSNVEMLNNGQDNPKAAWTRPTLEVTEINSSTQAGGGTIPDGDSLDPS